MGEHGGRASARWTTRVALSALAVAAAVGAGGATALAQSGNHDNGPGVVESTSDPVPSQYIVTLKTPRASAPAAADALTRGHGGQVISTYSHALSGYAARMSAAQALELSRDPAVASVAEDGYVHATETANSWGLDRIDQRNLPLDGSYTAPSDGAGVTAYVIDTGIRITNVDFGGRASVGIDEIGDGWNGLDCYGHGTHVSGTIGGATYGVAKKVSLVSVRVLDCNGSGTWAQVIAGIDWVTSDHIAHPGSNAVANMSLGGGATSALDTALANSVNSGVTYAVAAGNSNANACNYSPARATSAITVGATDINDARASYSNYGSCVDLFAPGSNIKSDWNTSDSATNTISGTSMATPHVAGSAALYLSANPGSTPAAVTAGLLAAATSGKVASPGTGSPNLLDFVGAAGSPPPTTSTSTTSTSTTSTTSTSTTSTTSTTTTSTTTTSTTRPPGVTVPPAPSLSGAGGQRSVRLGWNTLGNGGSPITGYRVYRSTSSTTGFSVRTTLGATNAFIDTGLTGGVRYYYRVVAINAVGDGPASNTVGVTPRR